MNKHVYRKHSALLLASLALLLLQACTAVNTFPTTARAGDTVAVMAGGSEQARKDTVDVRLTDSNNIEWNLQDLGLVRSLFNLRAAGTAYGSHYSSWLDMEYSWLKGHEPVQTVLVLDIPPAIATGPATLSVNLNADDDSSGISQPFTMTMDIVAGNGNSESFYRQNFDSSQKMVDFQDLEPAPYAKISFGNGATGSGSQVLGAVSMVVDFNQDAVNGDDLNVYVPESNVRGSAISTGKFGGHQRMVSWRRVGSQLHIDVIAPTGIEGRYLQVYIVHPRGVTANPGFSLTSINTYDVDGNPILFEPTLSYIP